MYLDSMGYIVKLPNQSGKILGKPSNVDQFWGDYDPLVKHYEGLIGEVVQYVMSHQYLPIVQFNEIPCVPQVRYLLTPDIFSEHLSVYNFQIGVKFCKL